MGRHLYSPIMTSVIVWDDHVSLQDWLIRYKLVVLMANGSLTRGDFFQQKKLKTVEVGSCRVVEKKRGSAVRDILERDS